MATKTFRGISVASLLGDTLVRYSGYEAVNRYLNGTGSGDLVTDLNEASNASLASRYKRAISLSNQDGYYYGKNTLSTSIADTSGIADYFSIYLEDVHHSPVTIDYIQHAPINNYHMVWLILTSKYSYSTLTNELHYFSSIVGKPCYLLDAYVSYCEATFDQISNAELLDPIGLAFDFGETQTRTRDQSRSATPYQVHSDVDNDLFRFRYTTRIRSTRTITGTTDTTTYDGNAPIGTPTSSLVSDTTSGGTRVVVTDHDYVVELTEDFLDYALSGSYDQTGAITEYDPIVTDPTLIATVPTPVLEGMYYMVGYTCNGYYYHYTYEADGSNTELESLISLISNEDVYAPNMYCRIDGKSGNHESFIDTPALAANKKLAKRLGMDYKDFTDTLHKSIGQLDKITDMVVGLYIPVEDTKPMQREYLYKWCTKLEAELETRGKPSEVGSEFPVGTTYYSSYSQILKDNDKQVNTYFDWMSVSEYEGTIGSVGKHTVEVVDVPSAVNGRVRSKRLVVRKQTGISTYKSYSLCNLGSGFSYKSYLRVRWVSNNPIIITGYDGARIGDDTQAVVVPMSVTLADTFNKRDREQLYNESFTVLINTKVVVKLKFYQTGIFKVVIFVAAVILALPTGGQSITVATLVTAVATVVVTGIVADILLTALIKTFDLNVEQAIGIVILVAIATGKVNVNNIGQMTAISLLKVVNLALSLVNKVQAYELGKLATEQEELEDYSTNRLKTLNVASAELGLNYVDSPPENTNKYYYTLGDSPSDFLQRSLLVGEITQICIKAVSVYCKTVLTLPTARDSYKTIGIM